MTQNKNNPLDIGFLVIKDFALMSFSAVVEPLRAANLIAGEELYRIHFFSMDDQPVTSSVGALIKPTGTIRDCETLDLFFVVAGYGSTTFTDKKIFKRIQFLHNKGIPLGGVSGGPFILAKAGVMQQRRLTVHWEHAPVLSELLPDLMLERSRYVIDRDRYTCAGGVAALDMMNAFLTERHGFGFAQKVSDWFLHTEIHPSAGPQRAGLAERYPDATQPMLLVIEAMRNHIGDPLDLEQLARLSGITSRQINRLFKEKMQQTTMDFYRLMRLNIARQLLHQSSLKVIEVAEATGFVSAAHFTALFNKQFGLTPTQLREQIRLQNRQ